MKRLTLALVAVSLAAAAVTSLVAAPLEEMEQFIPDKPVVIHPAVESQPERQGSMEGPGTGLGTTPPAHLRQVGVDAARRERPGRAARAARRPPPIPPPPPAPEINAAGAAVEQTTQGKRAAIEPVASFRRPGRGLYRP